LEGQYFRMPRFGWAGTIPCAEDVLRATTIVVLGLVLAATFATSLGLAIAVVVVFAAAILLTLWLVRGVPERRDDAA